MSTKPTTVAGPGPRRTIAAVLVIAGGALAVAGTLLPWFQLVPPPDCVSFACLEGPVNGLDLMKGGGIPDAPGIGWGIGSLVAGGLVILLGIATLFLGGRVLGIVSSVAGALLAAFAMYNYGYVLAGRNLATEGGSLSIEPGLGILFLGGALALAGGLVTATGPR